MKKHVCLLVTFLAAVFTAISQASVGIIVQPEYNRAVISGTQTNSHLSKDAIKQKVFIGGKFGFLTQFDILPNFKIESQLAITLRGISYKRNSDSMIEKNHGSYNFIGIEIPFCLLVEFPAKDYTAKRYFGGGPVLNYHVSGILKYNEKGNPYTKEKIGFGKNAWSQSIYGITVFAGLEDSENQNLRIGINYFTKAIQQSETGKVFLHQAYISYCYLF